MTDPHRITVEFPECEECKNLRIEIAKLKVLANLVTIRQVFDAGDDAITASGLSPWCINEGQAAGDETLYIS